jgi:hypothetical protein
VVVDEWPKLEDGAHSELVDEWGLENESAVEAARLSDPAEAEAARFYDTIEQDREEARRDRVDAADGFVPALLWVALITGGTLLVVYILTFANPGVRWGLQALQLTAVTTVASLNLCVVAFLDSPFSGAAGSIEPTRWNEPWPRYRATWKSRPLHHRPPATSQVARLRSPDLIVAFRQAISPQDGWGSIAREWSDRCLQWS